MSRPEDHPFLPTLAVSTERGLGKVLLYVAAIPPPAVRRQLLQDLELARRACGFSGEFHGDDRLHMTLHPVFHPAWPATRIISAACRAIGTVRSPSLPLFLERMMVLQVRNAVRPLVRATRLEAAGLVRDQLRWALAREGLMADGRRFLPHVTISWGHGDIPERPMNDIGWTAHELVLVCSHVGQRRHEHLGRWPLGRVP